MPAVHFDAGQARRANGGTKKARAAIRESAARAFDAPSMPGANYLKLSEICLKPAWVLVPMSLI